MLLHCKKGPKITRKNLIDLPEKVSPEASVVRLAREQQFAKLAFSAKD
jgi:hypothetical protein